MDDAIDVYVNLERKGYVNPVRRTHLLGQQKDRC